MSCSCNRNNQAVKSGDTESFPHEIRPGESCIYCAEKHMSMAYSYLTSSGLFSVIRQRVIGELELARRHAFNEYSAEAALVKRALIAVMSRADAASSLISEAMLAVQKKVNALDSGTDTKGTGLYKATDMLSIDRSPLVGELFLCSAWELATECGYFGANRGMIVGDLAIAQKHWAGYDDELVLKIKDIRHAVQRSEQDTLGVDWMNIMRRCDASITGNIKAFQKDIEALSTWLTGA